MASNSDLYVSCCTNEEAKARFTEEFKTGVEIPPDKVFFHNGNQIAVED